MHCLRAGAPGRGDDGVDVEVALPCGRRPDGHRDVCLGDVAGARVGVAEDRDRADAHRTQSADHPNRNLATVGNQDGVECCTHAHIRKTP